MEIETPTNLAKHKQRIRAELELLLCQPGPHQVPPCQNCTNHQVENCSSKCSQAPRALSSDPDNYPLEPKVVPLVYELRKTRVMQPCWSCEGHMDPDGKLWKFPQVCFYSSSPLYAMLLVNCFTLLKYKKQVNHDWIIVVSGFGQQHGGITYTIEPKLYPNMAAHLGALQADLAVIASDLEMNIKNEARKMLEAM